MKKCSNCGKEKELCEFYTSKTSKDKLTSSCKDCVKARSKKYYKNNKERCNHNNKRWAESNKSSVLKAKAKYRNKNRVKIRKYESERRKNNPDYNKEWRNNNKNRINESKKLKRKSDINYKISCYLRSRVSSIIRGTLKTGSAINDLGCSIDELKAHLEKQFVDGMCWDNYGSCWHIDHIKPLSSFKLADKTQFLEACHYTNLQPLWAKDNLSKGAKISEEFSNV